MNNNKISDATYATLQAKYGKYGSWALWQRPAAGQKLHAVDCGIDSFAPQLADAAFRQTHLTSVGVALALNWSDREPCSDDDWANFHDITAHSQDYKAAKMLLDTPFEGSYMTDAIKNFPETKATTALKEITKPENADKFAASAAMLQEELDLIQPQYLIIFGRSAEELVKIMVQRGVLNLGDIKCEEIDHYANMLSYEKMAAIAERLRQLPLDFI